jgi:hypothetical protein
MDKRGKEGERMKAYELMAKIAANPKEYEGRRYRVTACPAVHWGKHYQVVEVCRDFNTEDGMTLVGVDGDKTTPELVAITTRTELEEIRQPVPFMEAAKAYDKCETVWCEWSEFKTVYSKDNGKLIDDDGDPISTKEILRGKWYIGKPE